MIKLFKKSKITVSVIVALTLAGCSQFDTRMQANGPFDYSHDTLKSDYDTGGFTHDEETTTYKTPTLTQAQKDNGFVTENIDVRPPTQIILPIEGVLLDSNTSKYTKLWFNSSSQGENIEDIIWKLLNDYLSVNNVEILSKNEALQQIETAVFVEEKAEIGTALTYNEMLRKSSYLLGLEKQKDSNSVTLDVQLLTFSETNNGKPLAFNYSDQNRKNIELRFVNNFLAYVFEQQKANALKTLDSQPLPIKLGFDDNYQIAWLVDTDFTTTWLKLPALFKLLNFEIVESDENLGYFLLKFDTPSDEYWLENNLIPFELEEAEYFIQLGESIGGNTSIVWLDENKKPLPDKKVTAIYLSITEQVRDVLLLKSQQTKPL